MRFKSLLIIAAACFVCSNALAQGSVKGRIKGIGTNKQEAAIPFANIYWEGTTSGTNSDELGNFSIQHPKGATKLIAKSIGYTADTLAIEPGKAEVEFVLVAESLKLDEVVIAGRQRGSSMLKLTPLRTEVITASGLCKMACCNLAESFENTASVSVGYSDAVSGARQIKMLGLAGTYTQMLDENRPIMRGIAAPYGLTYTPGQWLESIQVSKGPGSVINGYEAITGQINVEHRKPTAELPLFVNLYLGTDERTEVNVASAKQFNENLSSILLVHGSVDPMEIDENNDGFKDLPTTKQVNLANRWLYSANNGVQLRTGFKLLAEERDGGQTSDSPVSIAPWGRYRSNINNKQANGYFKLGIPIGEQHHHHHEGEEAEEEHDHEGEHEEGEEHEEHHHSEEECEEVEQSIALIGDYTYHTQDSYFGIKDYAANMHSVFLNLMYQGGFNAHNRFTLGTSFRFDKYDEMLTDRFVDPESSLPLNLAVAKENKYALDRTERVFGGFGEYTLEVSEKATFIAGARIDHNSKYGWLFTPRANFKWDITDNLTLRASGGRGYKSPNPISDNMGILATGRQIVLDPNLKIEDAWTYGASLVKYFKLFNDEKASISLDAFRTQFNNQLIVDQELNAATVSLYNLDGKSYTNTIQADLNVVPLERFSVFMTYRYTEAKVDLRDQGLREKPLVDKFKALINLQYATAKNKWTFDFTSQLNGQMRLPNLDGYNAVVDDDYSPVYPMFFGQITRKFNKLDVYVGCENIGGYTQEHPIISADSPFSTKFNSSSVWGPLMGRKAYVGVRFTL